MRDHRDQERLLGTLVPVALGILVAFVIGWFLILRLVPLFAPLMGALR